MVGVGPKGKKSEFARVSIVDYYGNKLLDKYVKPDKEVTDYRTPRSGIKKDHLENGTNLILFENSFVEFVFERTLFFF